MGLKELMKDGMRLVECMNLIIIYIIPKIIQNYAGIGTIEINDNGLLAVYENTLK